MFAQQPRNWLVGLTSLSFILLQSACTAVMAISGVRVVIGLGALAAAAGLNRPATGFHADAIRIPMLAIALIGAFIGAALWAVASHSHNHQYAARGRMAALISGAAALIVGAAPGLVNFFEHLGTTAR